MVYIDVYIGYMYRPGPGIFHILVDGSGAELVVDW